jgi:hypothetical protein
MAAVWACEKLGLRTLLNYKLTIRKVSVCTDEYMFSLEQYHSILWVIWLVHCTGVLLRRTYLKSNSVVTLLICDNSCQSIDTSKLENQCVDIDDVSWYISKVKISMLQAVEDHRVVRG